MGLNPKPILTNRLVGLKPQRGPVAQLVERGAYTLEYIESNIALKDTPKSRVQAPPGPHIFLCV